MVLRLTWQSEISVCMRMASFLHGCLHYRSHVDRYPKSEKARESEDVVGVPEEPHTPNILQCTSRFPQIFFSSLAMAHQLPEMFCVLFTADASVYISFWLDHKHVFLCPDSCCSGAHFAGESCGCIEL